MATHAVWPWTVRLSLSTAHKAEACCVTVVVVVLVVVSSTLGIVYSSTEREANTAVRMRRVANTMLVFAKALEMWRRSA
jgi:hypothetical protein